MKELAEKEVNHSQMLKELEEQVWREYYWNWEKILNMMTREHSTSGEKLGSASLPDRLIFAMNQVQQAVEF